MSVTVIIFVLAAITNAATADGYFPVVLKRGVDFSFTCPYKVEDLDLLTISRINVTNYSIGGSSHSENPRPVYNTSTGGLSVGLQNTGRYAAIIDEKDYYSYYSIYISRVQPEDSGTWRCQVVKPNGISRFASFENLIVLGTDVRLAFQRRLSLSRVDVYDDELEIDLTEPQLKTVAFVVNVSHLMPVKPNASITACYEDGSSYNITSRFFHTSEKEYDILPNGLTGGKTFETFGGRKDLFVGDFNKTRGKVTLEGVYQYSKIIFTRSLTVKILAPPIINPDNMETVFDVADDIVLISTHVVAHPRIASVSLRLQNRVVNFTDLYNNNVSQRNNITVSIFKAEGKFYNWYNLTIKYEAELMPGFIMGNSITVTNAQGSDSYNFYLNRQLTSRSSSTIFSAVVLTLAVLFSRFQV